MTELKMTPTRAAGLTKLREFLPSAGRRYAEQRNYDHGPDNRSNISVLSPYISHRLITEREVVAMVLQQHRFTDAEKFVQEVFWRTYWKGWLEMRPAVWDNYVQSVGAMHQHPPAGLADAVAGNTGIECFDAWVAELIEFGYLHNHARMWFASIWIFTLGLPWQFGADFFYRHLLDGDAASNTLSWRWVAGLQTAGKTYLAQSDNIAKYTGGRFRPKPLFHSDGPESEPIITPQPIPELPPIPKGRAGLLITEEELTPESLMLEGAEIIAVASVDMVLARSPLPVSEAVNEFTRDSIDDGLSRAATHFKAPSTKLASMSADAVTAWANAHNVVNIITAYVPVGPLQRHINELTKALAKQDITLVQVRRDWDSNAWPHAKKGFFAFKEKIPELVAR